MPLLSGQLASLLLLAVVDAAVLSWVALRWYRSTVRRLMIARAPAGSATLGDDWAARPLGGEPIPDVGAARAGGSPAGGNLQFARYDLSAAQPAPSDRPEARARAVPRPARLWVAYLAGGLLWSAVMTSLYLAPDWREVRGVAWVAFWWANAWLVVPTLMFILAWNRRTSARGILGYLAAGALAISLFTLAGQVIRWEFSTAPITNVTSMFAGLVMTTYLVAAVLLITGLRRVRAVMPLALAGVLVFGVALIVFSEAVVRAFQLDVLRRALLESAISSPTLAYYGLFLLLALPVGWISWRLLGGLAAGFEHKWFSDVQLIVDCWWVVLTVDQMSLLALQYGLWALPGAAAAFVAYRGGVALALRGVRQSAATRAPSKTDPQPETVPGTEPGPTGARPVRLTLLRVFGYQRRTESLFDRVAQQWRFRGPVQLIAGTDLATRTTDPGDILAWLQGQLATRYVRHAGEIATRIAGLDMAPDPDGRFRVNEIYCHDNTWRPTLQALLDVSDRVLADLRGFRAENAGCRFELEELLGRVAAGHIVIVYDGKTDLALLEQVLGDAWSRLVSSGHAQEASQPALVRIERQSEAAVALLMECLTRRTA